MNNEFVPYDVIFEEAIEVQLNEWDEYILNEAYDSETRKAMELWTQIKKISRIDNVDRFEGGKADMKLLKAAINHHLRGKSMKDKISYDWYNNGEDIVIGTEAKKNAEVFARHFEQMASKKHIVADKDDSIGNNNMSHISQIKGPEGMKMCARAASELARLFGKWYAMSK